MPGVLVDVIVVAPDQMQTTHTPYDPAISGEIFRPLSSFETPEFGVGKVIARRVAQELRDGDAVNIGFGISANVPRILIEEGRHGDVTWVIEQGAVGGVPLLDFQFGCASNAEAIVPSPAQFTYFQGGGFDMSLLSFLQIDRHGSVNVSKLGVRPHVTAGAGGFVDITARAKKIVFSGYFTAGAGLEIEDGALRITREGKIKKLVDAVEQITFSGPRAVQQGQEIVYVTERCVMRLEREGVTVIEIAPGVDLERDVLAQSEFPLRVSSALKDDGRPPVPSRADRPDPARRREGGTMSDYVDLAFEGPLARLTLKRGEKLNALDMAMIHALADAARAIDETPEARVAILSGEGKAFCAGGDIAAWGALPPLEMWRELDARGPSRLRGAGAAAHAADRRPDRPRLRRRAGTGGGRRHQDRRARRQAGPAGDRSRHGAGLVGLAAARAPLRRLASCAAWRSRGRCSRARRRWRSASSTNSSRRAKVLRAPKRSRPTSASAALSRCRSSRR